MTCEEARLRIGAEPGTTSAALEEHLQSCAACTRFREEMRTLDADIGRALQRPPQLPGRRVQARPPVWRQWALAASVLLAVLGMLGVWLLRPSDTLASEVVAHVEAEPQSWLATQHLSAQGIDAALRRSGVELAITSDTVTYARSCWFRGHYVPHLVVQTAHGPATVLILRHEQVRGSRSFHEDGMSGVIVPAGIGSIAVLARRGGDLVDLAGQMQRGVRWLPEPR
jgi:Protein of unknown function (DUF3379)